MGYPKQKLPEMEAEGSIDFVLVWFRSVMVQQVLAMAEASDY